MPSLQLLRVQRLLTLWEPSDPVPGNFLTWFHSKGFRRVVWNSWEITTLTSTSSSQRGSHFRSWQRVKRSKNDASRKSTINTPQPVNIPSLSLGSTLTWARRVRSCSCRTWQQWINSWKTPTRRAKMSRPSWLWSRKPWNANSPKRSPSSTRTVRVSTLSLKRTATSSWLRGGPSVTRLHLPHLVCLKLKIQRMPKFKSSRRRNRARKPLLKKLPSKCKSSKFRRKSRRNLILWMPRLITYSSKKWDSQQWFRNWLLLKNL